MGLQIPVTNGFSEMLNTLYASLEPAVWIVNFSDGQSVSSKQFEDFASEDDDKKGIPYERRQGIVAFRLKEGDQTYTITRKRPEGVIKGFFYHIKAGRSTVMGEYNTELPIVEERFGCCYNRKGDALCILIDHSAFLREVHRRKEKCKELFGEVGQAPTEEIEKILYAPVTYQSRVDAYYENIVERRVNIALFGSLDDLEEVDTPPLFFENNVRRYIPHGRRET